MSLNQSNPYPFEELLSTNTSPGVDAQFHLGNLLVNLLHEMNDKVDEFVSQHLFSVKIGDQKANIITFDLFTTQDDKVFCPTHHKPGEFVAQQFFNLVCLLDGNGNTNAVDGRFN